VANSRGMHDDSHMPRTVVIVDDHAHFRASARAMLELEGFDVVGEAVDGSSGVALVEELEPELVLLDVSLPDVSGFEIARRLAPSSADVVLVSSRDGPDYGSHAEESGARGFIPKDQLSGRSLAELLEAER
jgi:DNA-binding NarL/FixJ family response regulator